MAALKLLHVSLTARDAGGLSGFYKDVFGYQERRSPRVLSGQNVSRGNGLPDAQIYSVWLNLPGDDGPFLELMEYEPSIARAEPLVNEPGLGHLAFEVENIEETLDWVIKAGGKRQGEIVNFGTLEKPVLIIYVRDPEGNILELEQH